MSDSEWTIDKAEASFELRVRPALREGLDFAGEKVVNDLERLVRQVLPDARCVGIDVPSERHLGRADRDRKVRIEFFLPKADGPESDASRSQPLVNFLNERGVRVYSTEADILSKEQQHPGARAPDDWVYHSIPLRNDIQELYRLRTHSRNWLAEPQGAKDIPAGWSVG